MNTQSTNPGLPRYEEVEKSIVLAIIFSIITFGIYYLFWQNHQMKAMNKILGFEKYGFWRWLLLSICTLGIYHIYFEFVMSQDLVTVQKRMGGPVNESLPLISLIASLFGMPLIADAIQQHEMHRLYGERPTMGLPV